MTRRRCSLSGRSCAYSEFAKDAPPASIEPRAEEPRLASLEQAVTGLARAMGGRRPPESGAVPAWLQTAAGNPLTYDPPEGRRVNVCAHFLPSTYASVKKAKIQLGLRTIAGTWEYIIRLGSAAVERMSEKHLCSSPALDTEGARTQFCQRLTYRQPLPFGVFPNSWNRKPFLADSLAGQSLPLLLPRSLPIPSTTRGCPAHTLCRASPPDRLRLCRG